MRCLPVKEYNYLIAQPKYIAHNTNPKSMFYFMREDRNGYPTTERKRGFVLFDDFTARFYLRKKELIKAVDNLKKNGV